MRLPLAMLLEQLEFHARVGGVKLAEQGPDGCNPGRPFVVRADREALHPDTRGPHEMEEQALKLFPRLGPAEPCCISYDLTRLKFVEQPRPCAIDRQFGRDDAHLGTEQLLELSRPPVEALQVGLEDRGDQLDGGGLAAAVDQALEHRLGRHTVRHSQLRMESEEAGVGNTNAAHRDTRDHGHRGLPYVVAGGATKGAAGEPETFDRAWDTSR